MVSPSNQVINLNECYNVTRDLILIFHSEIIHNKGVAFSTHAGTCRTGKSIKFSYGAHGKDGRGNLIVGDLGLILENEKISEFELTTETITLLDAYTEYSVTLKGIENEDDVSFKGFLIRLEAKNGQHISSALNFESEDIQSSPIICGNNVEAITHKSNEAKSEIPFKLEFEEDGDYHLEVTVVVSRSSLGSNDWYYSSFDIKVETEIVAPPSTNRGVPSDDEISLSPSESTTLKRENVSSDVPSFTPEEEPSSQVPSESPIVFESDSPTIGSQVPSETPIVFESDSPTKVSQVPSETPIVFESDSPTIVVSQEFTGDGITPNKNTSPWPKTSSMTSGQGKNSPLRIYLAIASICIFLGF